MELVVGLAVSRFMSKDDDVEENDHDLETTFVFCSLLSTLS